MDGDGGPIDLDHLLKLRLVVARVGEMDVAQWWNTKGQLGPLGESVLRRGFPRTHHFAQARSVFAVAAHRTQEIYDPPNSVTLWRLPPELEDRFEVRWEQWIDNATDWAPFFEGLHEAKPDLEAELSKRHLISDDHLDQFRRLRRSADLRAVEIPGEFTGSDNEIALLALAFARGERGKLAVPYQSWKPA